MTKAKIAEGTRDIVIPSAVALGVIGMLMNSLGVLPTRGEPSPVSLERVSNLEARQAEHEKSYREDRNEYMRILMKVQSDLSEIKGEIKAVTK